MNLTFCLNQRKKSFVVPQPSLPNFDDDDDMVDDADMDAGDLLEEYGAYAGFLRDLNPVALTKNQEVADNRRRIKTHVSNDDDDSNQEDEDDSNDDDGEDEQDSDEEQDYEQAPRSTQNDWKADSVEFKRLPAFGTDGKIIRLDNQKKALLPREELDLAKEKQEKVKAVKEQEAVEKQDIQLARKEEKKKKKDASKTEKTKGEAVAATLRASTLSPKERIQARWDAQETLAELASDIIQNPEDNLGNLKQMYQITGAHDPVIQKLGLLSQLTVFRDIIPGYRIRPLTDAEKAVTVTKDVRKIRDFEEGLLSHYQYYLQQLESSLRRNCSQGAGCDSSIAIVAIQCMSELLTTLTHFNFRVNLLSAIVSKMGTKSPVQVGAIACNAICKLFDMDISGEPSLEAVKLVARMIKNKEYKVDESVLKTFLHLRLKDEMVAPANSAAGEEAAKKKKIEDSRKRKSERNAAAHVSKKMRKVVKKDNEIASELKEAEATYSHEEKQKNHSETLKFVFLTYFRILKNAESSPLVPSVLEGLSNFGHLINVDFFADILALLKKLTITQYQSYVDGTSFSSAKTSLHCIVAALLLLSGQGDAINIDLKDFNMSTYCQMSRLPMSVDSSDAKIVDGADEVRIGVENEKIVKRMSDVHSRSEIELVLMGLDLLFCRKKQIQIDRCAAFIKRLATVSLHLKPNAVLACLSLQRALLVKHSKLQQLLDPEERLGTGVYKPFLDDAELCNPFATNLWELSLLMNHYHPTVRSFSKHVANTTSSTSGGVTGTKSLPTDLNLNPTIFLKKFNTTPEYPTPTFVFVPPVTEPNAITTAIKKRRENAKLNLTKSLADGPAIIDPSEFLIGIEDVEQKDVLKSSNVLSKSVVTYDIVGDSCGDKVLDALVRRERRLRKLVEISKELQIDLLPEDDDEEDEEGGEEDAEDEQNDEFEEEEGEEEDDNTFPAASFLGKKSGMNGAQRAETFIASLKRR
ncbi:Nucleolar complex protein 3 [Physocladia obscura]|uniref:Nucleolar complex protein 3 n=1 Tax=Physocladia obscura TaxID=109957 RepID=A0AAD5T3N0_9FUNG|nr:Nucleolar complex protein 3 [Physocladia obscura]